MKILQGYIGHSGTDQGASQGLQEKLQSTKGLVILPPLGLLTDQLMHHSNHSTKCTDNMRRLKQEPAVIQIILCGLPLALSNKDQNQPLTIQQLTDQLQNHSKQDLPKTYRNQ